MEFQPKTGETNRETVQKRVPELIGIACFTANLIAYTN